MKYHHFVACGFLVILLISCAAKNKKPLVSFALVPESGQAPLEVSLDASKTNDPDGSITDYIWDLGDRHMAEGIVVSHTYTQPGTYTINLTVTDDRGDHAAMMREVSVFVHPPPQLVGPEGGTYAFPGGIKITVPPEAVANEVAIDLRPLNTTYVNVLRPARLLLGKPARVLTGFVAWPDSANFNKPIEVSIPVAIDSGYIPMHAIIDLDSNTFKLTDTDLIYDPNAELATLKISNFSAHAVAQIEFIPSGQCIEFPCRCGRVRSVVLDEDQSINGCERITHTIFTTFLDCDPVYTEEDYQVTEISGECEGEEGLDVATIDWVREFVRQEYNRMRESIPYGSEWEVTITGEEKMGPQSENWRYLRKWETTIAGSLSIDSAVNFEQLLAEIIEVVFWLQRGGVAQADLEDVVRNSGLLDMWINRREIELQGTTTYTESSVFWRTADGHITGRCEACGTVTNKARMTMPFYIEEGGLTIFTEGFDGELSGPVLSPTQCVTTWRNGSRDVSLHSCEHAQDFVPAVGLWDIKTVPFEESSLTVRKSIYPPGISSWFNIVQLNLKLLKPPDPFEPIPPR